MRPHQGLDPNAPDANSDKCSRRAEISCRRAFSRSSASHYGRRDCVPRLCADGPAECLRANARPDSPQPGGRLRRKRPAGHLHDVGGGKRRSSSSSTCPAVESWRLFRSIVAASADRRPQAPRTARIVLPESFRRPRRNSQRGSSPKSPRGARFHRMTSSTMPGRRRPGARGQGW